jgi:hypothetical protein
MNICLLVTLVISRDSIVASIPACHSGDRGSIPCCREFLYYVGSRCGHPFCFLLSINASPWYFVLASSNNNKQTPDNMLFFHHK